MLLSDEFSTNPPPDSARTRPTKKVADAQSNAARSEFIKLGRAIRPVLHFLIEGIVRPAHDLDTDSPISRDFPSR